jgi:hypothetical protein
MSLSYSEDIPTEPGWYWERRERGVRIMYFPHCGTVWPTDWRLLRDQAYEQADEGTKVQLLTLPADTWKVEYAGPIPEPDTAWKSVAKGEMPRITPPECEWEKEVSVPVLALDKWGHMRVAVVERWESDQPFKWHTTCRDHLDIDGTITHWQYLPEIPKK